MSDATSPSTDAFFLHQRTHRLILVVSTLASSHNSSSDFASESTEAAYTSLISAPHFAIFESPSVFVLPNASETLLNTVETQLPTVVRKNLTSGRKKRSSLTIVCKIVRTA